MLNFFTLVFSVFLFVSCGINPKLNSKSNINKHFVRLWHPSREDIYLYDNFQFKRIDSPFLISKKYSGTYSIENNRISFNYKSFKSPKNELNIGKVTDSTLTIYYIYLNKDSKDTISNIFKLVKN